MTGITRVPAYNTHGWKYPWIQVSRFEEMMGTHYPPFIPVLCLRLTCGIHVIAILEVRQLNDNWGNNPMCIFPIRIVFKCLPRLLCAFAQVLDQLIIVPILTTCCSRCLECLALHIICQLHWMIRVNTSILGYVVQKKFIEFVCCAILLCKCN